jgi:hypothetical protein
MIRTLQEMLLLMRLAQCRFSASFCRSRIAALRIDLDRALAAENEAMAAIRIMQHEEVRMIPDYLVRQP